MTGPLPENSRLDGRTVKGAGGVRAEPGSMRTAYAPGEVASSPAPLLGTWPLSPGEVRLIWWAENDVWTKDLRDALTIACRNRGIQTPSLDSVGDMVDALRAVTGGQVVDRFGMYS